MEAEYRTIVEVHKEVDAATTRSDDVHHSRDLFCSDTLYDASRKFPWDRVPVEHCVLADVVSRHWEIFVDVVGEELCRPPA